jgi:hypothetical protein
MITMLPWYFSFPLVLAFIYASMHFILKYLFNNSPTELVNSPFATAIVQSSIVYVVLNWMAQVLPCKLSTLSHTPFVIMNNIV